MGLSQDQIEQVFDTIIRGYNPSRIILFGSYAKGNPSESSDLDLLIIKDTEIPKYKRAAFVRKLFDILPCAMDILVYTPSEYNQVIHFKSLIPYIASKEGKIVYERGN
ncbi:MAG: nucleotidyltransferase domain-containing protein [Bacteroidetes bacterium]|nr:nucleotidyltransferase domain-containing protein [Bacteroidota bacterium]